MVRPEGFDKFVGNEFGPPQAGPEHSEGTGPGMGLTTSDAVGGENPKRRNDKAPQAGPIRIT